MQPNSRLTSSAVHLLGDESGRSLTEFALLMAIVVVVIAFLVLAVRKISLPDA